MKTIKKYWFEIFIVIAFSITLFSCDIQKKAIKNKEDRTLNEQTETITKRLGDTVSYIVPKITYKDTTIYTVNRQGTTLRTVYDSRGKIDQIECFSSMIEEITRSNRELVEVIKQKDQEKTEDFDSTFILYGFIGIGIVLGIILFIFLYFANKNTKILNLLLQKIT